MLAFIKYHFKNVVEKAKNVFHKTKKPIIRQRINYYEFKTDILKRAVNNGFIRVQQRIDGISFFKEGLFVIIAIDIELDNKRWVHISASRGKRVPTYSDLSYIKNVFLGEDKKAIQIFPEKKHHINIHKYCLHLFYCMDGDGLPEFSKYLPTI